MPDVNWLAVLAAGISNMVVGFLWYGPLFGKTWQELMGWSNLDPLRREQMKNSMAKSYILTFIAALLMAYVLSHVITFSESFGNPSKLSTGLMTAFWMWLGFVAPLTLGTVLWEGKSWKLWFLNNSYNLVTLLIMGVILISWK